MDQPDKFRSASDLLIPDLAGVLGPAWSRRVLESAPAIIYVYDVKAERVTFQNRRLGELLGHPPSPDPQAASEWGRFMHPDDAAGWPAHRARLKSIGKDETLRRQIRMHHANGEWHHFTCHEILLSADGEGNPWLIVGNTTDITEQKLAEERKSVVLDEMRHRARNFAAVIDAIGRQSLPNGDNTTRQFFETLMGRLRSLLDAGELVLASDQRLADVRAVAELALAPFATLAMPVLSVTGPAVAVPETMAGSMALALHELATNAVKYGALSQPGGTISLSWQVEGANPGYLALEWKERCTHPVSPPAREGFGTRLIRFAAPRRSTGTVNLDFELDGLRCRMRLVLP